MRKMMEKETTQGQQGAKAHQQIIADGPGLPVCGCRAGKLNAEWACGLASRQ